MGLNVSSLGGGLDPVRVIARIIVDRSNLPITDSRGNILVSRTDT